MKIHTNFNCLAILALAITGIVPSVDAATVYQNTTNPFGGGFLFNGATVAGQDLAANIDIDELTLAPPSSGESITSLSVIGTNFNTVAVDARPTLYLWAADGAGGLPSTLLGVFALPLTTFAV